MGMEKMNLWSMRRMIVAVLSWTFAIGGAADTYYVNFNNGSDADSGSQGGDFYKLNVRLEQ